MNKRQIIVLWIGIIIIVLMGLFPPWMNVDPSGGYYIKGYNFILDKPSTFCRIDVPQLLVQWAMVAIIAGGLLVTLRDSKKD